MSPVSNQVHQRYQQVTVFNHDCPIQSFSAQNQKILLHEPLQYDLTFTPGPDYMYDYEMPSSELKLQLQSQRGFHPAVTTIFVNGERCGACGRGRPQVARWLQEVAWLETFTDKVLLKAGEPQLRPIRGLAARLAKRPELKTLSWLEILPCLRDNKYFLLNTLEHCTRQDAEVIAKNAEEEHLADEEFVIALVKKNGNLLRFASLKLQGKPDVVNVAMKENPNAFGYASAEIRADYPTALWAVSHNGRLLQEVSGDLKANMEILRTALSNNLRAYEFAGGDAKTLRQLAATE
ncbi:unnamed protein product, partial [Symbiodinium sp. KB8]